VGGSDSASLSDMRRASPCASVVVGAPRHSSFVRHTGATSATVSALMSASLGGGGGPVATVSSGDHYSVGNSSPLVSAHGSEQDISSRWSGRDGAVATFYPKLSPLMGAAEGSNREHAGAGASGSGSGSGRKGIGRISECASEAERDGDNHHGKGEQRALAHGAPRARAALEDPPSAHVVPDVGPGDVSDAPLSPLLAPLVAPAEPTSIESVVPAAASAAAAASASLAPSPTSPPSLPMRCLVVDDTASNAKMLKLLLMKKKFEVDVRENGQEGVDAVRESLEREKETGCIPYYDLVCIDYTMPVCPSRPYAPTAVAPVLTTCPPPLHSSPTSFDD